MIITDELLMAYADEELSAEERAQVDAALARNPQLAERVAQHRALRQNMQQAFAGVLTEPVPERLLAAVHKGRSAPAPVDLAAAREAKRGARSKAWTWREWGAIAASLLVGLLFGNLGPQSDKGALVVSRDGGLIAQGALARSLSEQLASGPLISTGVHVQLSFRDKSGAICRSFLVRQAQSYAGLACHEGGKWRIPALTEAEPGSDTSMQMAGSSLPPVILAAVNSRIAGEPLDADGERAAQARGW
ncbi:MAG TPA: zf-HC2 domain-containing protein [Steroidobacteraceae bacterium]